MPSISSHLRQALREALLTCGPFSSDSDLSNVFADERISPWQHQVPSATTPTARVNAIIRLLSNQYNTDHQHGLVLFLRVLSDLHDPALACHRDLSHLADALEQETGSAPTAPTPEKSAPERYVDFDLHITQSGHVTATSNEGEATATVSTIAPDVIQLALDRIKRRQTDAALIQQVGREIYEWIFPGSIHTHFHQTEAVARSQGAKIRLRLRIEANAIARLPLEFAFREAGGYFLAVNPKTVLSRYLHLSMPPGYVRRRKGPLHVLAIVANPSDQAPLNPDEWESILQQALAAPLAQKKMTLQTVKQATRREIRNALLEQKPDIVQFIGHGIYQEDKGYLALVQEDGTTWALDDARFANLFMGYDDHLGLVSLATCESAKSDAPQGFLGIAPQLVQRGVPAVVAMQYAVYVKTAKIFLEDFYTAVAAAKSVDWALQQARNAISLELGLDNREFATPTLYMRAQDGNVF